MQSVEGHIFELGFIRLRTEQDWFVCTHMSCKKTVAQMFGLVEFVLILSLSRFGLQAIDLSI